jgi:hypothetical protein
VFTHLSKVRVDDRVLRVLTAVQTGSRLRELAMRGARYGLPGWVSMKETRGAKVTRVYLDGPDAEAQARDYLSGSSTAGDVAGRTLALIAMAIFADQDAVATSNRVLHTVEAEGMPWADDVGELIDALVVENIGDRLLADQLGQRAMAREERRVQRAAEQAARAEVTHKLGRLAELSDAELEALPATIGNAYSYNEWAPRDTAQRQVREERERRAAAAAPSTTSEPAQALADILARLGDALSLPELSDEQLNELTALAGEALAADELAAVLAAVTAERERRIRADTGAPDPDDHGPVGAAS